MRRGILILLLLPLSALFAVDVLEDIIYPAQSLKGAPYSYGAAGPRAFDCSGLIYYLYKPILPTVPRSSKALQGFGTPVGRENLRPGDLLLFATAGPNAGVSHVAVYIGGNSVIHAISNGPETGVVVSSIDSGYWRRTFHSARRVLAVPESLAREESADILYERGRYTGSIKNGEPSGDGVMYLNNGDVYKGEFRAGVFHGEGSYTWADGTSFTGTFRNGEMINPPAKAAEEPNYLLAEDSPWEEWDGEVYGDYREWRVDEQSAFEAFKARDKAGAAGTLSP